MSQTLVAMYDDFADARRAVESLVSAGFSRDKISVAASDVDQQHSRFLTSHDRVGGADGDVEASEGAGFGAVVGTLVGLGTALIPGIGPVLAGGGALGWAALSAGIGAAAGALTGGIVASLVDLGIPQEEAHTYLEGIRRGGTMVVVQVDSETEANRAENVLNQHRPFDIDHRREHYKATGWSGYNENAPTYSGEQVRSEQERWRTGSPKHSETELPVGQNLANTSGVGMGTRTYPRIER